VADDADHGDRRADRLGSLDSGVAGPGGRAAWTAYAAGEVARCDLWFPDIQLPVEFGQSRGPTRLPVLVMVTGYARWLSARPIPRTWTRLACSAGNG
jgi:hypothetical protein